MTYPTTDKLQLTTNKNPTIRKKSVVSGSPRFTPASMQVAGEAGQMLVVNERKAKGFVLIELLVVMAIGSILFGLGAMTLRNVSQKGHDAQRKGDVKALKFALETYFEENGQYPPSGTNEATFTSANGDNWIPELKENGYIKELPKDPKQTGINIFAPLANLLLKRPAETVQPQVAAISTVILRPSGQGSYTGIGTQFPNSGAHWDKVDEISNDGDSTYIGGAVLDQGVDTFTHPASGIPPGSTINQIEVFQMARKAGTDPASWRNLILSGSQWAVGVWNQPPSTYTQISTVWTTDPATSAAWTIAGVDAVEIGTELGFGGGTDRFGRATQVWMVVTYTLAATPTPTPALTPTRLYLPSTGAASISPNPDGAWEDISILARLAAVTTKIASAMGDVSFADANDVDRDILFRQYVSAELAAGQTITGAQALKWQIRGRQPSSAILMFTALGVRVINNNLTVQKTVLAVTRDDNMLIPSATVLYNRQFTATSAAGNYTTVAGDRLVFEIGTGGDPVIDGHDSVLRIGDASGTDLPEDGAATDDYNPWVELTDTLTFVSGGPTPTPTPAPTATPTPTPTPTPPPLTGGQPFTYYYFVPTGHKSFVLWTQLENENDKEVYNQPNAECRETPPAPFENGQSYNFCLTPSLDSL